MANLDSAMYDCRTMSNAALAGVEELTMSGICFAEVGMNGQINTQYLELHSPVCQEYWKRVEALGGIVAPNGVLNVDSDSSTALEEVISQYDHAVAKHLPMPPIAS